MYNFHCQLECAAHHDSLRLDILSVAMVYFEVEVRHLAFHAMCFFDVASK